MAKKKEEAAPSEEITTAPEQVVASEVPAPAKTAGPIAVKFRNHVGEETERTFSKEVHGDNFAALAEEFKVSGAGTSSIPSFLAGQTIG